MGNAFFVTIVMLILILAVLYAALRITMKRLSETERKATELNYAVSRLNEENANLREEMKIISRNRSEADEKIDSLHDGDSVANAIDGLCKH